MPNYPYGRIKVLAEKLEEHHIAPDLIAEVMEGGEAIRQTSDRTKKQEWMDSAMRRMFKLMDKEIRQAVREDCACCLGGKREKISKSIAKEYATLEERIAAANQAKFVFGHGVFRHEDGRIRVEFSPEGQEHYRCVCLGETEKPLSMLYCYCCGGHVKHHLQNALGQPLKVTVRSSALSSTGKLPCTFLFDLVPAAD